MKLDESHNSFFRTTDIGLTTALITLGLQPHHVDTTSPSRAVFFFTQSDKLANSLKKYWEGSLLVEPKTFWNTLREVKARIKNDWTL